MPWKRKWPPTSVFLPGEFCGQRSLEGYSPWGGKESDMTEGLHTHTHTHTHTLCSKDDSLLILPQPLHSSRIVCLTADLWDLLRGRLKLPWCLLPQPRLHQWVFWNPGRPSILSKVPGEDLLWNLSHLLVILQLTDARVPPKLQQHREKLHRVLLLWSQR